MVKYKAFLKHFGRWFSNKKQFLIVCDILLGILLISKKIWIDIVQNL